MIIPEHEKRFCRSLRDFPQAFDNRYDRHARRHLLQLLFQSLVNGNPEYLDVLFQSKVPPEDCDWSLREAQDALDGSEFGGGSPDSTADGASTCGVRMPPSAMPSPSRTIVAVPVVSSTSRRGASGGAVPSRTHVSSPRSAALITKCCGPSLTTPQPRASTVAPTW